VQFDWPKCVLIDRITREEIEIGQHLNGLYWTENTYLSKSTQSAQSFTLHIPAHDILHARCGHLCDSIIATAIRKEMVRAFLVEKKTSVRWPSVRRDGPKAQIFNSCAFVFFTLVRHKNLMDVPSYLFLVGQKSPFVRPKSILIGRLSHVIL
jgi:hypothetical protein